MAKTLVLLATYNEIENLPRLVDEILHLLPETDVLVVDDNSPDGTGRWCEEAAQKDSRIQSIHREGKLGLGSATIGGLKYALEKEYETVVTMDADFSHPPRFLPDLLEKSGRYDVVIGSRYCQGGKIEGWPLKRLAMSRAVNTAARWLLGLQVRDCSGAFRCYRSEVLRKLDFDALRATGYAYLEEILWHLKRVEARIGEVPITFVDRQHGSSKINLGEALAAVGVLLRLGIRNIFRI